MSNAFITPTQFFTYYDARTFAQLSGDQGSPQGDPAKLQTILDAAAGILSSTLANRVTLPLASVPEFLRMIVADLAAKRLFGRRAGIPKDILETWKQAEEWLKDFREGVVSIPDVAPAQVPVLQDSDFTDGRSRFDRIYGQTPSETGPSRGE